MSTTTGKRTAKVKLTLTKRTVENLQPADKPWIAWDDRLSGFGVRVQPSGTKVFVVNYRIGRGGRKAPNRRLVIGRHGLITADQARRRAREILGRVALGDDPLAERARSRSIPTLREAFEDYLAAGPRRRESTIANYRRAVHKDLGDWLDRSLDDIDRRDVEQRFRQITERAGWVQANIAVKLVGALYRRPCLDFDDLRNPVERWRAGGGRLHRPRRRRAGIGASRPRCATRWSATPSASASTPACASPRWSRSPGRRSTWPP